MLGAVGLMCAMAVLTVVIMVSPPVISATSYILLISAMAKVAAWIIEPSLLLTVVAGLLAIAATPGFQDAGWVWAKAATSILILEGGLHVLQPIPDEAKRGAGALVGGMTRPPWRACSRPSATSCGCCSRCRPPTSIWASGDLACQI